MTDLLGRRSAGATSDFSSSGRTAAWNFVANASGNLVYIYAQTKVANPSSAGWRLGIYADSAGSPGALLGVASVTIGDPTGTGVFGAQLANPIAIVSGTTYWLAWYATDASDTHIDFQGDSAGSYIESGILVDFSDPFNIGSTSAVNAIIWGEDVAISGVIPNSLRFPRFKPLREGMLE